jgi:DNA-binding NarL/FixJ family response regulator
MNKTCKIRIAIIEDHELSRLGIKKLLEQKEEIVVVGEAANGVTGMEMLKKVQPDIAIIDIGLPDKDGIQLTQELKALSPGENLHTKVLILTVDNHPESVLAAFAAGADSYCTKYVDFDTLVVALRNTYEGNCWIDPAIAWIVLQAAQRNTQLRPDEQNILPDSQGQKNNTAAYNLSTREIQVLRLMVDGCTNCMIAQQLDISLGTVKSHVRNILSKLGADDRTQAAVRALRDGLLG